MDIYNTTFGGKLYYKSSVASTRLIKWKIIERISEAKV